MTYIQSIASVYIGLPMSEKLIKKKKKTEHIRRQSFFRYFWTAGKSACSYKFGHAACLRVTFPELFQMS